MVTRAQFSWNGYAADGGGNFMLQPGISPSTAVLRFPLSVPISQLGTLGMTNGTQTTRFTKCRVVRAEVTESGGGGRWREVTIEDRRWLWGESYFAIYGEFNRLSPPRGKSKNTLSAYLLAVRILNTLKESGYTISGMPADQFPTVSWDAASPSSELDLLCTQYGCGVTLTPSDTVSVFKIGQGTSFNQNDGRLMDFQSTFQPQIIPGQLVLDGGAIHCHHDLPLRAVAPKSNYSDDYVPIDELSYKPNGAGGGPDGWEQTGGNMNCVDPVYRKLAADNVFKVYEICEGFKKNPSQDDADKIKLQIPPTIDLSGGGSAQKIADLKKFMTIDNSSIHRLLPLNEKRYGFGSSLYDTAMRVYGFWWAGGKLNRNVRYNGNFSVDSYFDAEVQLPSFADSSYMLNLDPFPSNFELLVPDSFRDKVDLDNGRVHFNQQMMLRGTNGESLEAWLRLRCSFPIRDPETMAILTSQYWYNPVSPIEASVTKVIKNSEIFLEYTQGGMDNVSEFITAAFAAIANDASQISHGYGVSAPYHTWVFDIAPDGIVRAVSWDQAESGEATTHIDYNIERPTYYETLNERRLRRLYTYNALINIEAARKQRRGITQVRFGGNRP